MAQSLIAQTIGRIRRGCALEILELSTGMKEWFQENGAYFLGSMTLHAIGFMLLGIVSLWLPGYLQRPNDEVGFDAAKVDNSPVQEVTRFELGKAPLEPTVLDTDTLLQFQPAAQTAQYNDDSPVFEEAGGGMATTAQGPKLGGLNGFSVADVAGPGGFGGVGVSSGEGDKFRFGSGGGSGSGFGGRGSGSREALAGAMGGTKASELAVNGALNWLSRHQAPSGNWSLQHNNYCTGHKPCSGAGWAKSDAAATGLALLPFLAAGQTHKSKGPYRTAIAKGIAWLQKHQTAQGDLSAGGDQQMYTHGIATIAMCEAYGMTKDPYVGAAAGKAIRFIEQAQNREMGGWRYTSSSTDGDTSVVGWQMMALKSGQLAGLGVDSYSIESVRKWLKLVSKGQYGGLFVYQPNREVSPAMTSVGLLCCQYLGARRDEPMMDEGRQYLLEHLPDDSAARNTYYWYYATMVMHNFVGPEWDKWNRTMRRVLIQSQEREGCAMGSWDPENPTQDAWGGQGGRLMTTCLATLTLEVYYRYLPLFQINAPPPSAAKKAAPDDTPKNAAELEGETDKKTVQPPILP